MINTNKLKQDINDRFILIAPDGGSLKKIYKLAEQIGYKGDIITCSKDRNVDGTIKHFHITGGELPENKDIIIIDDICDGGLTFIETANQIKDYLGDTRKGKIYLIVTHSIFSKGTDELLKYFDGIYTTNSYKEHNVEKIKVLNIF